LVRNFEVKCEFYVDRQYTHVQAQDAIDV